LVGNTFFAKNNTRIGTTIVIIVASPQGCPKGRTPLGNQFQNDDHRYLDHDNDHQDHPYLDLTPLISDD
jgi:hypothetical protein